MRIILSCILSLSLVLFSAPLAYADEEVSNDALSDVVFGYSADGSISSDSSSSDLQEEGINVIGLSGTDSSSESSGEFASDDLVVDDLSEDSEEVEQKEEYLEEIGAALLDSDDIQISPLNSSSSSISLEYIVAYIVYSVLDYFLDFGYASFEAWLADFLGIEVVDYTYLIYDLLYRDLTSLTLILQTLYDIEGNTDRLLTIQTYLGYIWYFLNATVGSSFFSSVLDSFTDIYTRLNNIYLYIIGNNDYLSNIYSVLSNLDFSSGTNLFDFLISLLENLTGALSDILDFLSGIFEALLDLLDDIVGEFDTTSISSQLSSLRLTLGSTFPFGVVFFVSQVLAQFSTDPVTPNFSFTLFGETINIDLSMFDDLALGCRYLLLVLFIIGLYKSTKDWIYTGGD